MERRGKMGLGSPALEGVGGLGAGRVMGWGALGRRLRPGDPPFMFPSPPHLGYQELGLSVGVSRACKLRIRQFGG